MLAHHLSPITIFTALFGMVSVMAQLTVTEPASDHWWVANGQNTLRWSGSTPTEFSVFINHPDPTVLTSKLALISVQPLYEYSKTITPTGLKAATGYFMELTNILNSTDIYVKSQTFEIKPVGSNYPPQTTASPSSGSSMSGSGSGSLTSGLSGSGSVASASVSATRSGANGKKEHITYTYGGPFVAGLLAAGLLCDGFRNTSLKEVEEGSEDGWIQLGPKNKKKAFVVGPKPE